MTSVVTNLPAVSERISAPGLDPITVVWVNDGANRGTVIIQCYDKAWTASWGATGTHRVEVFFLSCDVDYLVGKLIGNPRATKREQAYLGEIVAAVQTALRSVRDETA
jgi:hypothetical protein